MGFLMNSGLFSRVFMSLDDTIDDDDLLIVADDADDAAAAMI